MSVKRPNAEFVKTRTKGFADNPADISLGAFICAAIVVFLPYITVRSWSTSVDTTFKGFDVFGSDYYYVLAAFAGAHISRAYHWFQALKWPCDIIALGASGLILLKTFNVFQPHNFMILGLSFSLAGSNFYSPQFGIVVMATAPLLLLRALYLERRSRT